MFVSQPSRAQSDVNTAYRTHVQRFLGSAGESKWDGRWCELASGYRTSVQLHPRSEVFSVVSGRGLIFIGGETRRIGAGTVVFVPAGQEHALINDGVDTLVVVASCWDGQAAAA